MVPEAIRQSERRDDVQVRLPDGRVFEAPIGTPLTDLFRVAYPNGDDPPVAAIVDGELQELGQPLTTDVDAAPVLHSSSDGTRIYSRSLSFLLVVVAAELFPDVRIHIEYSVPHGGFFCRAERRKPFTSKELARIKTRMAEIVVEDLPIERKRYTLAEAREIFSARGEESKARLLEDRATDHLHLYSLNGTSDYYYGYMVPSTGVLKVFGIEPFSDGFILRFPRREEPAKLLPPKRFTALREVFDEYGQWLRLLGMRSVESLNDAIRTARIEQIVLVSEALHEKRIAEIAGQVAGKHRDGLRLVFIAGPSASGKTTFSKRLAIQLLAEGLQPYPLAMDNYYLARSVLRERFGRDVDVDSLDALDLERLRSDLGCLVRGERVTIPRFDFRTGERTDGQSVQLGANQILLVEGIHGLNPELLTESPARSCYRVFVSALTQLNLDIHNRVSTTDTRLIRRIVRDAVYRGYSAEETLGMWDNVRRGEKQNIYAYQEEADVMFNSALGYELAVLKPHVEPLLLQIRHPQHRIEAERLLALLWWFDPYTTENIPGNSILREFIGGSILREYTPVPREGTTLQETDRATAKEAPREH
ncbi:nucleoside kinase [Candidatus Bipolaricaulota bacterium]